MPDTSNFLPVALLGSALCLGACSVRPQYMVRVENSSSATLIAQIIRDVSFEDDEVLAQSRVRPNTEVTLGPVQADPFQKVELLVSRPGDLQTLPEKFNLSRGSWVAAVADAPISTWSRFRVDLSKTGEPIETETPATETPDAPTPGGEDVQGG